MDCTLTKGISVKLPISAMVVGYNEAGFLKQCLQSISFCEEIFYTDLGSTDSSIQIAKTFGCQIERHAKVPSCEMIQTNVVHRLKNDWVVFIDPDERVDEQLANDIVNGFGKWSSDASLGAIMVPWQFYFGKRKLKGTVWGGINKKYFLVNRKRFDFEPVVHYGRKVKPGFITFEIPFNGDSNLLHHYWMKNVRIFLKKHLRYLGNEGMDQYNLGVRQGIKKALLTPFRRFSESYFNREGYKDGLKGLFLSSFWACYQTYIVFDILRIQNRANKLNSQNAS